MNFIKKHAKTIVIIALVIVLTIGTLGLYNQFKKKSS